jgi:hypothetical protein
MTFSPERNINIFLSYAHEDQDIADAISSTLRSAFYDTFDITLMSEFQLGLNWRDVINESISATDIMIAIATGRLKPGHSYTGFEVGSFTASMKFQPNMKIAPEVARRLIPFAVLDQAPATLNEFEGIDIDPKALHALRFDASNAPQEIEKLTSNGNEAKEGIVKFLSDIQDIINDVLPDKAMKLAQTKQRIEFFNTLATTLCQQLISSISNREESSLIPKSKLIIRVPPGQPGNGDYLSNAEVETQGPCTDSFGVDRENARYNWPDFLKQTPHKDIANSWNDAFKALVRTLNESDFVERNTILSFDRTKTFRVFVSRVRTLFSGLREYHLYVIPLLKPKEYGDQISTMLVRALQISLGYRFMFLERSSEFSPEIIKATRLSALQSTITEMQNSLNLLLQTADDAGLNDPEHVVLILGNAQIDDIYELWDKEKDALYKAASDVIAGPVTLALKESFVGQLESFCEHTREMNKRYTARALTILQERITA